MLYVLFPTSHNPVSSSLVSRNVVTGAVSDPMFAKQQTPPVKVTR